jgi:hypothetical protein
VNNRFMTRLALVLWAVSVGLSGLGIVVLVLSASTRIPPRFGFRGSDAILAVVIATVGALIAVRRPHNPVGWLFAAAGLIFAITAFAAEYRVYAVLTRRGSLPLGPEAAWVANWSWPLLLGVLTGLFLLFPEGRLLSGRWRPLLWAAGLSTAVVAVGIALEPGPLDEFPVVRNPFGIEVGPVVNLIGSVGILGMALCLLAAGLSLLLRLRRSRGVQRQQLKWIAYAAVVVAIVQVGSIMYFLVFRTSPMVLAVLVIAALAAIPVAAAIAILKYRLYDIDRLINRTLVYGVLTALLAGVYAVAVLVLGQVFGGVTGDPSSWAVAGATLAVAALFQPARRRIQQVVDRRFNRRKYDTARTIEAFSARLRDQVDLDTLAAELLAVVDQTMQPTTASFWLRTSIEGRPRRTGT